MRFFWQRATREATQTAAPVLVNEPILIPAGEFLMGSDRDEDNARPQHRVYLPDYSLGKYPVTVAQYWAFCKATGRERPPEPHSSWQWNHPVSNVSWQAARVYCEWVGGRLPSEAEWEKAARGTEGRAYPWGNEPPDRTRCNFGRNVGSTTDVDRYPQGASPYGCLDLAGNVWEWTHSLYAPYPYTAEDGREDPQAGRRRVLRGGSWLSKPDICRAAYRYRPGTLNVITGFRVVFRGAESHGGSTPG